MRSLFCLLILTLLAGCSSPRVEIQGSQPDPGKPSIIVAMLRNSQTPFKRDLVEALKADYADQFNIVVREVRRPEDLAGQNYDALIVMDTLKAWLRFNGGLLRFAKQADQSRTVYFISTGDAKWRWNRTDLRHVTAATPKAKLSDSYTRLRELLDEVLSD